jgi:DNA repair protein RecO (recombination protein O)
MLTSAQGIILYFVKYGDHSVIVNMYTREFGRQAYILSVSRSRRSSVRTGILQPLFMVDLVAYQKETREIQRIKEIRNHPVYQNIPFDVVKSAQAIFIAEILGKTLREQECAPDLYDFITNALQFFDLTDEGIAGFHLWFLIHLTDFLGFKPDIEEAGFRNWFDMRKGGIVPFEPSHPFFMHPEATGHFCRMASVKLDALKQIRVSRNMRNYLTTKMVEYYQLHFEHLGEIKSLKVLHELFS